VENDETLEQAVTREVKEETGLDARSLRLLFEEEYEYGTSYCYLAELCNEWVEPITGYDPEEGELPALDRLIQSVAWILIKDIKNDRQVSKVISALGLKHD
jgi:8-oxo-dGTP pyrophosphatase MutT (NUDIX family)